MSRGGSEHCGVANLAAGDCRGFTWKLERLWVRKSQRGACKDMPGHSHGQGHQADSGAGVPGDALHHAAHGQGLHAASSAHLPEPHRAVVRACGRGQDGPGLGTAPWQGGATAQLSITGLWDTSPVLGEALKLCPHSQPLGRSWGRRKGRSSSSFSVPQHLQPQQRRDVTRGCCRENRPPPHSPQPATLPVVPPPDVDGSRRSCRAGCTPGLARHGSAQLGTAQPHRAVSLGLVHGSR